jgi:cobalt/nickel transport system permease protein
MHIPDNYLSPQTCAVMAAVMVPVWSISVKKVTKELPKSKVTMMGVGAAFSFLGMMFNIPLPGGTTGHAVGGTMLAVVLGPYAACISVSVALLLQALLFGDGGVLSFGANCFNMAFVLPFAGYAAARFITALLRRSHGRTGRNADLIGAAAGSYIGINAAAFCTAVEFGIQPMLFRDAAGNALYCPYGLQVALPAMMIGHLTVFGAAEVIYTTAILAFIRASAPELLQNSRNMETSAYGSSTSGQNSRTGEKTFRPLSFLLAALIVLTPLGLLAEGTAWGEWGAGEIASTGAGFTPAGMTDGFDFHSLLPDYSVSGMPGWIGYMLSAVIGAALLLIIFRLCGSFIKTGDKTPEGAH